MARDAERAALAQARVDLAAGANAVSAWDALVAVTDAYIALFLLQDPSPRVAAFTADIAAYRRKFIADRAG